MFRKTHSHRLGAYFQRMLLEDKTACHNLFFQQVTDSNYRNKDDNKVKGYGINVTESCDKDKGLNLISHVDVRTVSTYKGYRYFTQNKANTYLIRRQIATIPVETLQIRNNVEATIFQLGYHYPNAKSRYRGLIKHQMWANIRCLWVNFVRILKYIN